MGRNRRKLPLLENVEIIDTGAGGKAVGKKEEQVVFVSDAVPGDVVDVQVTRKKKKLLEGRVVQFHSFSERREKPFCDHFDNCGGCKWQHMGYESQLYFKEKQVRESLKRIGGFDDAEVLPILPAKNTTYYRNKLEFTFSDKRWLTTEEVKQAAELERNSLGFHVAGRYDRIIDIEHCYLQAEPSNAIRNAIREYALKNGLTFYDVYKHEGFLRNLIIRTASSGEVMVILAFGEELKDEREKILDHIAEQFPEITALMYVINTKKNDTIFDLDIISHRGESFIIEEMPGFDKTLRFMIGPKSFYQTNSEQAFELYKIAMDLSGLKGDEVVYDLYTGTGTIANFVAHRAKKVVGIEFIEEAIADAKKNSELNNIDNTCFFAGDMKDVLNEDFIAEHGKPDVIITDPPRAGMHPDVVKTILNIAPEKIVYVSCNPATQARDMELLKEKYTLQKSQPVDMFPHTHHVENVVLLEQR